MVIATEISTASLDREFARADIEFDGVDHTGPSFEARVFFNKTTAEAERDRTAANGYAGSFYVFGHGNCFGDVGHCDVRDRRSYDPRPAHPLTPAKKVVIATDAVRHALAGGASIAISVIPVVRDGAGGAEAEQDVLKFEKVRIVTYR
jgi:tyrosinase